MKQEIKPTNKCKKCNRIVETSSTATNFICVDCKRKIGLISESHLNKVLLKELNKTQ